MSPLWGIDVGGTKLEGAILDSLTGDVVTRVRIPTQAEQGYDHILDRVGMLVRQMEDATGLTRPARIGIGTPGIADRVTGIMKNCNTVCMNGKPMPQDLTDILGVEVRIGNDANCFALAEARLGAAKGLAVVFGIIMGTGVGGGLVVQGHVLAGAHGIAGEWGHLVLTPDGDACYCGKRGCVETVISGPALERFYERHSGTRLTMREIATRTDDPHARATLDRLVCEFGRAAAAIVNIVDPDALVLGGGVGSVRELHENARSALAPWVFHDSVRTQVLQPRLGDSAGVFGAAMLVEATDA